MSRLTRFFICLIAISGMVRAQFPAFDSLIRQPVELPSAFDLRWENRTAEIKTQPTGGCWASAAMASLESFFISSRAGNPVFSDLNLQRYHGFLSERDVYGNHVMATAYFSRGAGPLLRTDCNDTIPMKDGLPDRYISQARFLPGEPDLIKKTILLSGAVYSMLYFRKELVDTSTQVLSVNRSGINHAVCLVGWKDTLETAGGRGVWIAQNSLGKNFGNEGFFYIPYNDPNILHYNAVWPDWLELPPGAKIHYFDTLGACKSYGFNDTVCYGMVKFTATSRQELLLAGTFVNHPGTKIRARVFLSFDDSTGLLGKEVSVSLEKICPTPGYYTIPLVNPVCLSGGQNFYIMMQYSSLSDTMPVPVECYLEHYSNPTLTFGRCWINPDFRRWPETWYECGADTRFQSLRFNLCIKAITVHLPDDEFQH